MRILEVLTPHVALARRKDPLQDAIQRMREEHVGVLAKDRSHVGTLEVGDVMSSDPVTATADEDVGEVLRRMRKFGVRRVPVVDSTGGLEGIVSIDDAVAGLSEELAEIASLVSSQREDEPKKRP